MHNASSSSALDDTYGERERGRGGGGGEREGEKELLAAISSRGRITTLNSLREDDVPMG